jgi:LacI family transcriptional regulator
MSFTTKDLARVCGVSLGTVDRAFRNRPGIKPETRERILAAAREYGYKPNILARNLKNRRTDEIGLIVHDLENEFFAQLVNAIQEIAWRQNYFLQIAISRRDEKRERAALEHMAGRNVDGILLFPASSGEGFDEFLRSLDRPIVTIANKVSPAWPFVGLSDRAIMRELTAAVIGKGYERLVFVGPLQVSRERINLYEIEERYAGFVEAVDAAGGLERRLVAGSDFVEEIGAIDLESRRTAVLCCSDIFALEILEDFTRRGLSVPTDVGLAGFDSIDALRFIRPRLSTVEYPIQRMGEIAFSLLVASRDVGEAVPLIELEPRIIWGQSI